MEFYGYFPTKKPDTLRQSENVKFQTIFSYFSYTIPTQPWRSVSIGSSRQLLDWWTQWRTYEIGPLNAGVSCCFKNH